MILKISPIIDVQTIQPARHFKANIQMKEIMTEKPKAARSHFQFLINEKIYLFEIVDKIAECPCVTGCRNLINDTAKSVGKCVCRGNANSLKEALCVVKQFWAKSRNSCRHDSTAWNGEPWDSGTWWVAIGNSSAVRAAFDAIPEIGWGDGLVEIGKGVLFGSSFSANVSIKIGGSEYFGCVAVCITLNRAIEHCDNVHDEDQTADHVSALTIGFAQRSVGDVWEICLLFALLGFLSGHIYW